MIPTLPELDEFRVLNVGVRQQQPAGEPDNMHIHRLIPVRPARKDHEGNIDRPEVFLAVLDESRVRDWSSKVGSKGRNQIPYYGNLYGNTQDKGERNDHDQQLTICPCRPAAH